MRHCETIRRYGAIIIVLVAPVLVSANTKPTGSILVRRARLIDGTAAQSRAPVSILIRDGRIAQIAPEIEVSGTPVLDVSGATVIPGLIDAHVHLSFVPGSDVRGDLPERLRALRAEQLRSYLACGVTTVLDTAITAADAREIQGWLAAGGVGPTVLMLGPPIAAPGGYMSHGLGVPVATTDDLDRLLDTIVGLGAIGVKVPLERGFGSDTIFPIHAPSMREAITRRAAERGLPIYVHASDEVEQTLGLEMGARGLLHLNFAGQPPSRQFVDRAARSGAFMVTTFSCIDAGLTRWHPERLDDRVVTQTVPAAEQRTARDPNAWTEHDRIELSYVFPRMWNATRRLLAWWLQPIEKGEAAALAVNLHAARTLHAAGVPIVIGSDAGNSSVISQFHGPSTLRELELLAEAGIANADVLAAATGVAARMLKIDADAGSIAVGKRGDLVVLDGDPRTDVGAFRRILWTVKSGIAHTPAEWMHTE